MSDSVSRFHVSNFDGSIHITMNKEMACEISELIRESNEVSKSLYALTEKIEKQFYYMGELTRRVLVPDREVVPGLDEVRSGDTVHYKVHDEPLVPENQNLDEDTQP